MNVCYFYRSCYFLRELASHAAFRSLNYCKNIANAF